MNNSFWSSPYPLAEVTAIAISCSSSLESLFPPICSKPYGSEMQTSSQPSFFSGVSIPVWSVICRFLAFPPASFILQSSLQPQCVKFPQQTWVPSSGHIRSSLWETSVIHILLPNCSTSSFTSMKGIPESSPYQGVSCLSSMILHHPLHTSTCFYYTPL